MRVIVKTDKKGLIFNFSTMREQSFTWPVAGLTTKAKALILPAGEGLYIPSKDQFWLNQFTKHSKIALIMPFMGVQYNQEYVSYLTPENERMV